MRGAVQFCYADFRSHIYENPTHNDAHECAVGFLASRLQKHESIKDLLTADGRLCFDLFYVATDESGVDVYWFQFLNKM